VVSKPKQASETDEAQVSTDHWLASVTYIIVLSLPTRGVANAKHGSTIPNTILPIQEIAE